jgi:hypothetical protein
MSNVVRLEDWIAEHRPPPEDDYYDAIGELMTKKVFTMTTKEAMPMIEFVRDNRDLLTENQCGFVDGVEVFKTLSPRQLQWLRSLVAKVCHYAEAQA